MKYGVLVLTYIFIIYMFYNIRKIKKGDKQKKNYNKIYFSIVMIAICFIIWGILRTLE